MPTKSVTPKRGPTHKGKPLNVTPHEMGAQIMEERHAQQTQLEHRDLLHSGRRFFDDETAGALRELYLVCLACDADNPGEAASEVEYQHAMERARVALLPQTKERTT